MRVEEGLKAAIEQIQSHQRDKHFDDLIKCSNKHFDDLIECSNRRFADLIEYSNKRFEEINRNIDRNGKRIMLFGILTIGWLAAGIAVLGTLIQQ